MEAKFLPYDGYLMGLPVNENYLVFRWVGAGKILFSVTRQGNAANCHFASDKQGLRYLKQACNDFADFVFGLCDWCEVILSHVAKPTIIRFITKVGFTLIGKTDKGYVYARFKECHSLVKQSVL